MNRSSHLSSSQLHSNTPPTRPITRPGHPYPNLSCEVNLNTAVSTQTQHSPTYLSPAYPSPTSANSIQTSRKLAMPAVDTPPRPRTYESSTFHTRPLHLRPALPSSGQITNYSIIWLNQGNPYTAQTHRGQPFPNIHFKRYKLKSPLLLKPSSHYIQHLI